MKFKRVYPFKRRLYSLLSFKRVLGYILALSPFMIFSLVKNFTDKQRFNNRVDTDESKLIFIR